MSDNRPPFGEDDPTSVHGAQEPVEREYDPTRVQPAVGGERSTSYVVEEDLAPREVAYPDRRSGLSAALIAAALIALLLGLILGWALFGSGDGDGDADTTTTLPPTTVETTTTTEDATTTTRPTTTTTRPTTTTQPTSTALSTVAPPTIESNPADPPSATG